MQEPYLYERTKPMGAAPHRKVHAIGLSLMSQLMRTSKTAKSFGLSIFASIRKLPRPPCLIILIVTFVNGRASSLKAN
jgi:hypothetical protein